MSAPEDIAAWARAQSVLGSYSSAIRGFAKAVALRPDDPKLRLDYAVALFNDGGSNSEVVAQLKAGLARVDPQKDPDLASRLHQNLVLAYLYAPPPDGFQNAISEVESLLSSPLPKWPLLYFYAACAYGQQYSYLLSKREPPPPEQLEEVRHRGLAMTTLALELDPSLRSNFQMVSDPNYRD